VSVSFEATPVKDDALTVLAGLKNLRELNLDDTPITDAGLAHLTAVPGLQKLFLVRTKVSDAGLKAGNDCRDVV
jgi:hypothetical protein